LWIEKKPVRATGDKEDIAGRLRVLAVGWRQQIQHQFLGC